MERVRSDGAGTCAYVPWSSIHCQVVAVCYTASIVRHLVRDKHSDIGCRRRSLALMIVITTHVGVSM